MIYITTSRKPGRRTRSLARDFERILPHSFYRTRGKSNLDSVIEHARSKGYRRVMVLKEYKGNPGRIDFIDVRPDTWGWIPVSLRVLGVKLQREFGEKIKNTDDTIFVEDEVGISYLFDCESDEDSIFTFYISENAITFFERDREIGPRIRYEVLRWK